MLDPESFLARDAGVLEHIQHSVDRPIADRVHVDLEAFRTRRAHEAIEVCVAHLLQSALVRGIRVRLGQFGAARPRAPSDTTLKLLTASRPSPASASGPLAR